MGADPSVPVALASLRGTAGLVWANRQGSTVTLAPLWPDSRRMALLAAKLPDEETIAFYAILAPEALDAVADLQGEPRPVLYWSVPRSALLELIEGNS